MDRKLFVFDLDKTLIKVNSSFKYFLFLYRKKVFSKKHALMSVFLYIKFSFFRYSPTDLHKIVFKYFLKNRKEDEIFSYIKLFLDENFTKYINKKVHDFLIKAKKNNHFILLLSNSPWQIATAFGKKFEIENTFGSIYNVEKGFFSKINTLMDGETKAKYAKKIALQNNIENITVITDSIWDKPLIEIAKICYVVNPDVKLKKIAKKNLWNFL